MPLTLKQPAIIDVYEGEYPVNFAGMQPQPLVAILRASAKFYDGYRRRDHKVVEYSRQCKELGIKTGLYHFLLPNNITEQAQLFLEVWDELGADLPPIVDVECDPRTWNVGYSTWAAHVKAFCDLIETHTNRKPMIYTSLYFWSFTGQPAWANQYPLWMAWYPDYPDNHNVPPTSIIPRGWDKWALWQYHDKGRTNGYLANDLNIASDWFLAVIGEAPPPPPPVEDPEPQPEPTVKGTVVAQRGVYVRNGPITSADIVGSYAFGTPVAGIQIVEAAPYRWLKLVDNFYSAIGTQDGKQTYIEIDGEMPPPPPPTSWPSNLYRVRHDNPPREIPGLPAPPEVNPLYVSPNTIHGTARTRLSRHGWENYFSWLLKDDPQLFAYATGPALAMFNNRTRPAWNDGGDAMESLVFGGAAVTGEVVGSFLKVKMMNYLAGPPDPWPTYWDDPLKVQQPVMINTKRNVVYKFPQPAFYPMVCSQDVYIPLEKLEPFPALPMEVRVLATPWLNEREEPDQKSAKVGTYLIGQTTTIFAYKLHGAEVWGKTANGWVALFWPYGLVKYLTTWRMATDPAPV